MFAKARIVIITTIIILSLGIRAVNSLKQLIQALEATRSVRRVRCFD